jgi:hypothetical protein
VAKQASALLFSESVVKSGSDFGIMPTSESVLLATSDLPHHKRIREQLQLWFDEFPATDKKKEDLSSDFRTAKKVAGKAFELFLYQVFKRAGVAITSDPGRLDGGSSNPDFLIQCEGHDLYVEAKFVDHTAIEVLLPSTPN